MTDDLVKRLRERSHQYVDNEYNFDKRAADHIEKLETALREIAQTVTIVDENWHPSYHDFSFTQKQAEGAYEELGRRIQIARKALNAE